jgi:hypothetical protein
VPFLKPTLVPSLHKRRGQQEIGGGAVARDGNVVDHGNTKQRLDVDVVRVRLQRIPEENHEIDSPLDTRRADLLVAAKLSWAMSAIRFRSAIGIAAF